MGTDKAHPEKERFAFVLCDQLACLGRGLSIGVNQIIALGFDYDKRVSTHDRLLSIRITFQRFTGSRRFPLWSLAVESFGP